MPFRFLDLPTELRIRVYELLLVLPAPVDLDPRNCVTIRPRLQIFLVSHRVHNEASVVFYSRNEFRIFAVHGRFFHTKAPLLQRLSPLYRSELRRLELRLGPGWTAPPKRWVVDGRLGLHDASKLRVMKVFVECDPASHVIFEGFRVGETFYTEFSVQLLRDLIRLAPSVKEVKFDGYSSVSRSSPLLNALINEAKASQKRITWGEERGWGIADVAQMMQDLSLANNEKNQK